VIICALNIILFVGPFLADSYFLTSYEFIDARHPYHNSQAESNLEEMERLGVKAFSLFGLFVVLCIEMLKILASKRNKFSDILSS